MQLKLRIQKKAGDFLLNIGFETSCRRTGILGPSGAGKSMTLKCLAGIERPDSGFIQLGDRVLFDSEKKINLKPQKRNIGYLFQSYALFPTMNVEENIAAGLKGNREFIRETTSRMIKKFRLEGLEKRLPGELSGGQQQRTTLARIMAYSPEIILLDEPLSSLDSYLRAKLLEELKELLSDYEGMSIMVSHDARELESFSEELIVIDKGQVVEKGDIKKIFSNPYSGTAALLTGNLSGGRFGGEKMSAGSENEFTHFDEKGNAVMVDVGGKEITRRTAVAEGRIILSRDAMAAVLGRKVKKGDVLGVATVAGIMGAKRTPDLIPLCHILNLNNVSLEFETDEDSCSIKAVCTVSCDGKTGVEMEALTGVSTALLTVYDMCKAIDRAMRIEDIHLVSKAGGKSTVETAVPE